MNTTPSRYYKLPICEGLEALSANNYSTPFPFHYHPTFNITLVYQGTFQSRLTDKFVNAPAGSILVTNPREIHANPFDKNNSVSFFTFYVSQAFLQYCNHDKPMFFNEKVIYDADVFTGLHNLSLRLNLADAASAFEKDLSVTLHQLAYKHGSDADKPGDQKIQTLFDDLLSADTDSKFSLEKAAKSFGVDKYKFLRLFKFQTGLTPNNYFILQRIEKSKLMLAEGKDLLSVAIDLGFYDTAHYCNHFKKFTGISPIAYSAG